ncbi:MAG: FAD-binding oxidoreductase [Actinomycetota bacterium]|nr:FAD-binding oxidoreductase [Actinomycetota bacterium]
MSSPTPPPASGPSRRSVLGFGAALLAGLGVSGCTDATAPGGAGTTAPPVSAAATRRGAVEALRKSIKGSVFLPGDASYEAASAARNGRYLDLKPVVVAQVTDAPDVVNVLKWTQDNGIAPVIRGGGHSYAGLSSTTGLVIDVSRLSSVTIDAATGTAVMGGAALNRDIFTASENGQWLLPGGTCGLVALGGLTLGGGIGYHTHWAGLTSDHLTATTMVTAAGEILEVDAKNHPDLFWALRGGAGGNFGVNVSFTFDLAKVPRANSVFYKLTWRGADAATAMLTAVDAIVQKAPAELNLSSMAQAVPVGSGGPREAIDVMVRGHFLGTEADLRDLLAPLLAIPGATETTIVDQPFWTTAKNFLSDESTPHSWGDVSRYTDRPVPSDAYARLVDLLVTCPSRTPESNGAIWSLGWVGGSVVDRFQPADTAYVHRGMKTLLRPTPVWRNEDPSSVGNEMMGWTLDATAVIDPHVPGNSYQNFPNRFLDGWQKAYYGQNWARLVDVKTTYDPRNVFTSVQGIPPKPV